MASSSKSMCSDFGGVWKPAETKAFSSTKYLTSGNLVGFKVGGVAFTPYFTKTSYSGGTNSKKWGSCSTYSKKGYLGSLVTASSTHWGSPPSCNHYDLAAAPSGYYEILHPNPYSYSYHDDGGGDYKGYEYAVFTPSAAKSFVSIEKHEVIQYSTANSEGLYGWHSFSSPYAYYPLNSRGVPDFVSSSYPIPAVGATVTNESHQLRLESLGKLRLDSSYSVSIPSYCST